jgi:hypothetical protein
MKQKPVTGIKKSHKTHILFSYREIVICMAGCKGDMHIPESNLLTEEV